MKISEIPNDKNCYLPSVNIKNGSVYCKPEKIDYQKQLLISVYGDIDIMTNNAIVPEYTICNPNIAINKHNKITIAFDFDNVIHKYRKGWDDGSIYDELNKDILILIKELLDDGHYVFILTTRSRFQIKNYFDSFKYKICGQTWVGNEPGMDLSYWTNKLIPFKYRTFGLFSKWWKRKGICGITNRKAVFDILIDDRVITFNPNKGITKEEILNFKTIYYK